MKMSKEENNLEGKKRHYIHGLGRTWGRHRLFDLGRRRLDRGYILRAKSEVGFKWV